MRNVSAFLASTGICVLGWAASGWGLTVKDTVIYNRPNHLIAWTDQGGKERKAALVKSGDHTGVCQYLTYYDGANKVTVSPGSPDADPLNSGIGSMCHHGSSVFYKQGALALRWSGGGMAVFDWTSIIDGAAETITYAFMDGHEYFQWAVTVDARAGTKAGDSRGPYATVNWDGMGGPAEGVEYGAKRYFKQPLLSGSGFPNRTGPWTLNGACDIPYAWEWAHNREIGYLASQTFAQQNQGVPAWSDGLPASGAGMDPAGEVWRTDYQMNFYDQGLKITWGQPYGWMNNSADAAAPACLKGGWGQYSLSIVLDAKPDGGVMRVRDENRAIHSGKVAFTASVGAVKAQGPVGTVNPALQTLSPPGYDHNYRAWWAVAADNQASVALDIDDAAESLVSPAFRFSGMTALPSGVTLNGAALISGKDYYASLDSAAKETWLTLARTLRGKNRIVLSPGRTGIHFPGQRREPLRPRAGDAPVSANASFSAFTVDGAVRRFRYGDPVPANAWLGLTPESGKGLLRK
ncbi:MAG: hypothetical protein JWP91_4707 [Fibrobacteres bacterium]|nr:hypothetical protein [Fibrobacterota bacterium]